MIVKITDEIREAVLQDIGGKICGQIPEGFIVSLSFENGCAFVELLNLDVENDDQTKLPDSSDKTLTEQLNDALCVAVGFKA